MLFHAESSTPSVCVGGRFCSSSGLLWPVAAVLDAAAPRGAETGSLLRGWLVRGSGPHEGRGCLLGRVNPALWEEWVEVSGGE